MKRTRLAWMTDVLPLATLVAVAAIVPTAHAQDPATQASALRRCAAIPDHVERLACYDALAGKATASPAAQRPPQDTFGLSRAQLEPKQNDKVDSISARIVRFGRSRNEKPTVELDNGQVWELDSLDPLLDTGDTVKIRDGALNSFLLVTPHKRVHRTRRMR
jgi:hypothetical protein